MNRERLPRLPGMGERSIVMAGSHVVVGVAAWTWAAAPGDLASAGGDDRAPPCHALPRRRARLSARSAVGRLDRVVIDPLVAGYLSHLAADLLTTGGLRLARPSPRRQAIGLCRTGSFAESVIVAGVAIGTGVHVLQPPRGNRLAWNPHRPHHP